jgi:circadian clock protein KaiB
VNRYKFRLFVTGQGGHSLTAISNLRAIGNRLLDGKYDLEVIDVLENPAAAEEAKIAVTPTLIKETPLPRRRMFGDLSHTPRVLAGLDIQHAPDAESED